MKRGFTLIELLVVLAIIGILSSIVIASVKCAKAKQAGGQCGDKVVETQLNSQGEIVKPRN